MNSSAPLCVHQHLHLREEMTQSQNEGTKYPPIMANDNDPINSCWDIKSKAEKKTGDQSYVLFTRTWYYTMLLESICWLRTWKPHKIHSIMASLVCHLSIRITPTFVLVCCFFPSFPKNLHFNVWLHPNLHAVNWITLLYYMS